VRTIERVTLWLANGAAPLLLLATALLVYLENRWATPVFRAPEGAFLAGSVGTEFAPLPVVLAPPAFAAVFATPPDPAAVTRGAIVYQTHCVTCHGAPGAAAGTWQPGSRQGEVIPPEEIGTDRERVSIRHAEALATRLQGLFASGYVARYNFAHPFATVREYLRPGPGGAVRGYINAPIEGASTRAVPAQREHPDARGPYQPGAAARRLLAWRQYLRPGTRGPRDRGVGCRSIPPVRLWPSRQCQRRTSIPLGLGGSGARPRSARGSAGLSQDALMADRPITLSVFTAVFASFALLIAAANVYAETTNFLDFGRTVAAVWVMIVLLVPAFCLYVWHRGAAAPLWRLCWTFALLAYWIHLAFAFGTLHGSSLAGIIAKQGALAAGYNFAVTVWWSLDVVFVWFGARGAVVRWQRFALTAALFIGVIVAAVVLKDGLVRWLGAVLVASVAVTASARLMPPAAAA